jgi:hypothetical protein
MSIVLLSSNMNIIGSTGKDRCRCNCLRRASMRIRALIDTEYGSPRLSCLRTASLDPGEQV